MKQEQYFVIGHKNPDTDSICSAIAYARLRERQGLAEIRPGRAGDINRQTEFVLETLGVQVPQLLVDVYPRVRDVIGERVVTVAGDAPLSQALELFHRHSIRMLPVIDGERRPLGLLFLKRVSERFLIPAREEEIRQVLTSADSICQCLKATPLHLADGDETGSFDLYVGAMASSTFREKMQGLDPRRMILITGDRRLILEQAVDIGVRILVVTGNLPVDPEIVEKGRRNGVTILSTPYDSATSTWLTRLSTPVRNLVKEDFQSAGLNERLDDLKLKLLHTQDPGVVVLDAEGKVAAVATKSNLLASSPVKLILVDHNELSQAVAGADKVEIREVVDHHRLGNFHTDYPIRFINQPLGSTCTVVATLYRQCGLEPEPQIAGLMLAGLLSDTVILKSPTTTEIDREIAAWLGTLCDRDPQEFGQRIFAAGSALGAYPSIRHLLLADFKEYQAGDRSFGVGQVEVVSFHEFHNMRERITENLEQLRQERKLDVAGLLITDIVQGTSLLLGLGGKELPYLMGYPQVGENLFELKGVLSRKKQLVPHLLKVLQG
ncbi:manganese-dependent inorganic pyrophosphatase [Desulfuromonas versatilis]|uniref:inorganic diphosphatase n=1 Tax=Desulfuromonas versatilis TaxID=2802975 RepID=A0ABM8HTT8_9BACT|nr:putative manganese-dependent inorganic diphosphatase [Desulfuromonas versatilis]BCR05735.1 manganese-dependent inorganic pyrophosphatase [Desulfuromonas versatilis]